MTDGHWAPKSDFLNNSRSCGFINNLGSGGGCSGSGSGTTSSSSNYSGVPLGATTSCQQQQNNGVAVGQQQRVINNSTTTAATTTAQQPRVATSLDALLADLDQLTGGLPDLGSRRPKPAVDSWSNSHNSLSNGGAQSCGEVRRKNSALQKSEIEGIYDIHALIRK